MKKILSALLSITMLLTVFTLSATHVLADQSGNFEYYVVDYDDGTTASMLTRYLGSETNVVVPDSLGGAPVTAFGAYAFEGNTKMVSVTIPAGVASISDRCFLDCTALASIIIPSKVYEININAFLGCTKLTEFIVDNSNIRYSSKNGVLLNSLGTTLIQFPKGKSGTFVVPNTVTSIGDYAFYQCKDITNVVMTDTVTSIGDSAFRASGVTALTIPGSVQTIGNFAFSFATRLVYVTIGGGVGFIGKYAFNGCSKLEAAIFLGGVPSVGPAIFSRAASNFKIYCAGEAVGFTNPWRGYVTTTDTYTPPTASPTPSPTPKPTPQTPVINTVTNNVYTISGKAIVGGTLVISVAGKQIFTAPSTATWMIGLSSALKAGTKVSAKITMPDTSTSTKTVYVIPALPTVKTIKAGSIYVTGTATKGAIVYAKIGTKTYSATATTGAYKIKIPAIKKGTSVTVTCKAGGQMSMKKVVKAV